MRKKTDKKVIKSVLTTVLGLSLGQSLFIPTVKADDSQPQSQKPTTQVNPASIENFSEPEFIDTRLYEHKLQKKDVITLRFKNIPILTFSSAPNYDAKQTAMEVAQTLDKLSQESIDATKIIVVWNKKTQDYAIKYEDQELARMNKYVQLPDTTKSLSEDALQATNRLRRLIGNAQPLTKIEGKSMMYVDSKTTAFAYTKNTGKTYSGKASWYGPGFHGRRTASGQIFNQNALTAAHRYLPFGTKVKVTNIRNGRSVIVTINDRGPFVGRRIIDLSAAAAQRIGMKSSGVAPVKVQVLGR